MRSAGEELGNNHYGKDADKGRGHNGALVEGKEEMMVRRASRADGKVSKDASDNATSRYPKRQHNESRISIRQRNGRNETAHKALKQIGTHSSNITNIVTNLCIYKRVGE